MKALKRTYGLLVCLTLGLAAACDGDVENEYSNLRAFCRVTPVTGAAPLFGALNNPGIFCTLTPDGTRYIFTRQNGTTVPMEMGATTQNYYRLQSIYNQGFIIGTPSVPDWKMQLTPVVFDIVCPNCYEAAIAETLTLQGEEAVCGRCGRHYLLRDKGIIIEGEKGRKLHQYHMTYTPAHDLFVINN